MKVRAPTTAHVGIALGKQFTYIFSLSRRLHNVYPAIVSYRQLNVLIIINVYLLSLLWCTIMASRGGGGRCSVLSLPKCGIRQNIFFLVILSDRETFVSRLNHRLSMLLRVGSRTAMLTIISSLGFNSINVMVHARTTKYNIVICSFGCSKSRVLCL